MNILRTSNRFIKEREIQELVKSQREFFFDGNTMAVEYRISAHKSLKEIKWYIYKNNSSN